jgi:uncharacterized membrane protein HdeD (DUF308 family)
LPGTAVWVLGLLVGINLLMMGFSIIMVAMSVRRSTASSGQPPAARTSL